jgi:hypothetical protein
MTAISIAAGTSMMQHRAPVSPSRGCPFLVDSVTGSVCGKEQRQIATVDGLMYCKRHAKMTDGDQVRVKEKEKFCPVCREEGRLTPARTELIYAGMCKTPREFGCWWPRWRKESVEKVLLSLLSGGAPDTSTDKT